MSKRLTLFLGLVVLIITAGSIALYRASAGSLPILDGEIPVAGLSGPVTIQRDRYGVPTIRGSNRVDVARATGFVHGQDRFFQMDLLRRSTAGELAELFGAAAADFDRRRRRHRLRTVARAVIEQAAPGERALLEAYTEGVNSGLEALSVAPFEYLVLRAEPEPWRAEDIVLGNLAMFIELTDYDASRESGYAALHDGIPAKLGAFIFAQGNRWDAPLVGEAWDVPAIPGPEVCDLRGATPVQSRFDLQPGVQLDVPAAGSNSWAVAGHRTEAGHAMVANDMHLGLDVPNTWYRVRLVVNGAGAEDLPELDLTGVTLPGTPLVVAGSNGSIAWGFTNSRGDWSDLVLLQADPNNPETYLTPDGYVPFEEYRETIEIKGSEPEAVTYRWTRWGPVVGSDHRGRLQALRWLAHVPEAVNLRLSELETAASTRDAVALAPGTGIPPQNFVVADTQGSVAWTIMGRIPRRVGYDSSRPASWADGTAGWHGWLAPDEYPRVVDPESGLIWTANSRIVEGGVLTQLGTNGYRLGARAQQIRDALAALDRPEIADMLAIQLDDRALLQQEWRDLLLEAMTADDAAAYPWRGQLRDILERWDGRAGIDSVGYRVIREFRLGVLETVLRGLLSGCGDFDGPIRLAATDQAEGPTWRLVTEQPEHLLPPPYTSWNDLMLRAADAAVATCRTVPLADCTWGTNNQVDIRHPLADALAILRPWLTIHSGPLPGGEHTPLVQSRNFGASERFAVSPGDEANGYFHMPGGQSGHPFSPFFAAGHEAWVDGEALPFLPGPALHRLSLAPQ